MKSLFPYLVMIVLFVIGAKLVNWQQKQNHSVRGSAPVEHPIKHLRRNLKTTSDSIKEFYNDTTSLFDSSPSDTVKHSVFHTGLKPDAVHQLI